MSISDAFRRFWPISLVIILLTVGGAFLIERGTSTAYAASGTIMIARPEVDPARSATRVVDLTAAIARTSTSEARERFAADGGRDDFRILQVSDSRIQVLATGDDAATGVRAVLRALADVVAAQQLAADVDVDERIRPRLFVQVPEDELESLAATGGRVSSEVPEAIGTLVLEDPFAGVENALGGVALATRLVLLSVTSDAGSAAVIETLPDGVDFDISSQDQRARELLTVTTTGPDAEDVVHAFDVVTSAVDAELQRRQEQAGAPVDARLLVDVVAAPLEAREVDPGLSGSALFLLAIGFGIAVALPTILREVVEARPQTMAAGFDVQDGPKDWSPQGQAEPDASRATPTR